MKSSVIKGLLTYMVVVVILWLSSYFIIARGLANGNSVEAGQIGDAFGSINSLFSGLAFAALFFTIRQQSEQLELQKNDLHLQSELIEMTRTDLKEQKVIIRKQQFNVTFMNMLSFHLDLTNESVKHALNEILQNLKSDMETYKVDPNLTVTNLSQLRGLYNIRFEEQKNVISTYFRSIQALFDLVLEGHLDSGEKDDYSSILKAYLSPIERTVLFYHCSLSEDTTFLHLALKVPVPELHALVHHSHSDLPLLIEYLTGPIDEI